MMEKIVPRSPWTVAAAMLLAALALRAWDFGNPVIHVDEQYYLLVGDRMLHGALPYVDIWDRKPIGLFALFAATRLLPGEGIVAYQIVALLFAAATAWLVQRGALRIGATPLGAGAAGIAYLIWLPLLSGRAGQSPVFFDLFMTAAAVLTLRLPDLAARQARGAIVANGAIVCLLAGLAIQTKYTPAVEGMFFGLAHILYLHRAGARLSLLVAAVSGWIALGLAPTLLAIAFYAGRGAVAFDAFWYANFTSIFARSAYSYPPDLIARRLLGISAQLAPFAICAAITWRTTRPDGAPRDGALCLAFGWLASALLGFVVLGTYFDHYALPLVAPFAIAAAPTFGRRPRGMVAAVGAGLLLFAIQALVRPADSTGAYALGRMVEANSRGGCPYVFTGDSATYYLAHACLPTAYAFPSTLAYAPEAGAAGIDAAVEVRRIMAGRPPVVVMGSRPLADWNDQTHKIMIAALARGYRPVFAVPRADYEMIAYLRRDLPYRHGIVAGPMEGPR